MSALIGPKAMQMINGALTPIIKSGKRIDNIKFMVCPASPIAQNEFFYTDYGQLKVTPGERVPKGVSYLIESPISRGGIGFAWVSRKAIK